MISLTITEIKKFMSHLLIQNTFDDYYVSEAEISVANTYTINGAINKSYYSKSELEEMPDTEYTKWHAIKPFCLNLIKGNKTPSSMKIIFLLSNSETKALIEAEQLSLTSSDINGLFINIKYNDGHLLLITGTSLAFFTLDKTIDKAFDNYVKSYLNKMSISFEEQ